MLIGYARVSTKEQNLDSQIDMLKNAGCEQVYSDQMSGLKEDRAGLQRALNFLREGDILVVFKLDRLGRSLRHLIEIVNQLRERKIGFKCLSEGMDTTTIGGQLIFTIFAGIAQFERETIRERTMHGLAAAKARGRLGGRKKKLSPAQAKHALDLYHSDQKSVRDICNIVGISRARFYEYLKRSRQENLAI